MGKIYGTGYYIPENSISNSDLAEVIETSDDWIKSHTGIENRFIASEHETSSYMGAMAAEMAIKEAGIDRDLIDMVILSTSTPDYNNIPATACLVHQQLKLKMNAAAFDLAAACSGFAYGLELARCLIASNSKKYILVVAAERLSMITNWKDRTSAILFGDAAGAVLMGPSEDGSGVQNSIMWADGSRSKSLVLKAGGSTYPAHSTVYEEQDYYMDMDGHAIYNFAVDVIPKIITQQLENNNLDLDDITYVLPHQANKRIIKAAASRSKIPMEKFYVNIEKYGNTSAASIAVALHELNASGKIKRGDKIITAAFGAGLTAGGNYIIW